MTTTSKRSGYSLEIALGLAGLQGLGLLSSAGAAGLYGARYAGATLEYGASLNSGWVTPVFFAIAGYAGWSLWHFLDRDRLDWGEPDVRNGIMFGFVQLIASGLIIAVAGLAAAGWQIDVMSPEQSFMRWLAYGVAVGGALQAATGAVGLVAVKLTPIDAAG